MKATLFALTTLFALAVSACSSSDDTGGTTPKKDSGTDGASATDTGTGGGEDTGSSTTDTGTASTETGGGGDDSCFAMADNSACQQCCSMNHKDGYNAFVSTLLSCGCKAGNCDTACKTTACAATPMSPDAACNTCLQNIQGTACKDDLTTACGTGGPCAPFSECAASCPM